MKTENKSQSNQIVMMVKYIKGGKEVVIHNPLNGNCWIEKTINGETSISKISKLQGKISIS
jgi:hypothetical protein